VMTRSGWSRVREWPLDEDERDLRSFLYTVDSARYPRAAQAYLRGKRKQRVEDRIWQTRPARRDGPLRKINLSDNEAREIQSVMSQIYPGVILNISGVVTGCPCEEGIFCSDQVWVVPQDDVKTPGVLLSRISGHWSVGLIQQWWMGRAQLQAELQADSHLTPFERFEALDSLWEKFPACTRTSAVYDTPGRPVAGLERWAASRARQVIEFYGAPNRIRTGVLALRGRWGAQSARCATRAR
jgi:hypothetical protein